MEKTKIKVGDVFFTSLGNICSPEIKEINNLYEERDGLYDPISDSDIAFSELSNIEAYDKTLINSGQNTISEQIKNFPSYETLIIVKYVGDGKFEELTTKETFGLVVPGLKDIEFQDTSSNDFVDGKLYHNAMEFAKDVDMIKKNPLKIFAYGVSDATENTYIPWDADGVFYSLEGNEQVVNKCKEQYLKQSDDDRRKIIMEMKECAINAFDKQFQKLVSEDKEMAELENKIIDFKSR